MNRSEFVRAALEALRDGGTDALDAVRKLRLRLKGASAEEFKHNAAAVGEAYTGAAKDNPRFFERGNKFARTPEGRAKQFGVSMRKPMGDPHLPNMYDREVAPGRFIDELDTVPFKMDWGDRAELDVAKKILDNPSLDTIRTYDTTQLRHGANDGKAVYAALFGDLAHSPGVVNLSPQLSTPNRVRRSFNQASALAREPGLSQQILTAQSQLRETPLNPTAFHRLQTRDQIGALQIAGVDGTLGHLEAALNGGLLRELAPKFKSQLDIHEPQALGVLGLLEDARGLSSLDAETLGRLQRSLRQIGNQSHNVSFGPTTARRLQLIDRALRGAPIDSKLTNHLEFKSGGSVGSKNPPRGTSPRADR